jgi:hypothetical protein
MRTVSRKCTTANLIYVTAMDNVQSIAFFRKESATADNANMSLNVNRCTSVVSIISQQIVAKTTTGYFINIAINK